MAERRKGWKGWLVPALAVLIAGAFAYLNSGERVAVHLGLFVLFRIPLAALVFVTFLLGMVTMFLIGLRHDLQVRRLLRQYRVQEERRPWLPDPIPPAPRAPESHRLAEIEPEPLPPGDDGTEPAGWDTGAPEARLPEPAEPHPLPAEAERTEPDAAEIRRADAHRPGPYRHDAGPPGTPPDPPM